MPKTFKNTNQENELVIEKLSKNKVAKPPLYKVV
ncbi:MAG: hypothetical protein CFH28_00926, partial [Alphaproteobacteria bacterium MarineAlpha6_Bin6]